jgi:hypothetical protein
MSCRCISKRRFKQTPHFCLAAEKNPLKTPTKTLFPTNTQPLSSPFQASSARRSHYFPGRQTLGAQFARSRFDVKLHFGREIAVEFAARNSVDSCSSCLRPIGQGVKPGTPVGFGKPPLAFNPFLD